MTRESSLPRLQRGVELSTRVMAHRVGPWAHVGTTAYLLIMSLVAGRGAPSLARLRALDAAATIGGGIEGFLAAAMSADHLALAAMRGERSREGDQRLLDGVVDVGMSGSEDGADGRAHPGGELAQELSRCDGVAPERKLSCAGGQGGHGGGAGDDGERSGGSSHRSQVWGPYTSPVLSTRVELFRG